MIQIESAAYLWLAALLLFLPLDWVLSAFTAAVIHEICHILAVRLMKGNIRKISISTCGCLIESSIDGEWHSILSILAGPAGSLSLLFLRRILPQITVCGLIQGLYNLLPLLPLDGGHALQVLLNSLCPKKAEKILLWTGRMVCMFLFFAVIWLVTVLDSGVTVVLISAVWIIRLFPRKIPCKAPKIGVQWL